MRLSLFVLPALFVLAAFPLAAQEYVTETEAQERESMPEAEDQDTADDRLYVITDFEFDITGRTRPSALLYNGEFRKGEELRGRQSLEQYVHDKTQILFNQRVLKDNAEVTYSIGEQLESGAYPVTITIKVEDSWNIVALPRPFYKSDSGFELSFRARDYNFLGTMTPLRLTLVYRYDEKKHNWFEVALSSNVPFYAFGYHWEVKFNNSFSYRPGAELEEHFFYQNVTGLSVEIPYRKTTFTFGLEEALTLNEENADVYKDSLKEDKPWIPGGYSDFQSGLYMSSRLYASWKIPTGFFVSRYGELTYIPGISATFNHELPKWELQEIRRGPSMGFSHSLYFEKIDWHVNYRDGISASISNSYDYNFYRLRHGGHPLSASLTLNATGHFIISKSFGISSRLQYRHWFYHDPNYYDSASDAMRGIADNTISANYMLSLNTDFPFRVLVFTPSEWFNKPKLKVFDFELHASPVIDMALYNDPRTETSFHPKNIALSGGLELIVFPAFMRSFIVRIGYAVNLRKFVSTGRLPGDNDNREIYIIMGHFY